MLGEQTVERSGVEFAQRVAGGIGKIDHDEIERIGIWSSQGKRRR